jgi:hypothetical protein
MTGFVVLTFIIMNMFLIWKLLTMNSSVRLLATSYFMILVTAADKLPVPRKFHVSVYNPVCSLHDRTNVIIRHISVSGIQSTP